jgi:hypothetical protein
VGLFFGAHPGRLGIPAHPALMAQGDIVHVDEDLVAPLAVPDLHLRVPGVGEDRPDRRLGPREPAAMRVAGALVGGGGRDPVPGQGLGDGVQAPP